MKQNLRRTIAITLAFLLFLPALVRWQPVAARAETLAATAEPARPSLTLYGRFEMDYEYRGEQGKLVGVELSVDRELLALDAKARARVFGDIGIPSGPDEVLLVLSPLLFEFCREGQESQRASHFFVQTEGNFGGPQPLTQTLASKYQEAPEQKAYRIAVAAFVPNPETAAFTSLRAGENSIPIPKRSVSVRELALSCQPLQGLAAANHAAQIAESISKIPLVNANALDSVPKLSKLPQMPTENLNGPTGGNRNQSVDQDVRLRTWTDATGKYHVKAKLIMTKNNHVLLQKEDQSRVSVNIDRLSERDRVYVRRRR